jgi:hypothetical protein
MRHPSVSASAEAQLLKVIELVDTEPLRARMEIFAVVFDPQHVDPALLEESLDTAGEVKEAPCGTMGCIAGWVYMLAHPELVRVHHNQVAGLEEVIDLPGDISSEAMGLLRISEEQRERLFYLSQWREWNGTQYGWPEPYESRYLATLSDDKPENTRRRADAICDRIRHFIETGE